MSDQSRSEEEKLLEETLMMKKAAMDLFHAQLRSVSGSNPANLPNKDFPLVSEKEILLSKEQEEIRHKEQQERLRLIKEKKPSTRTASEYLFYLGMGYRHSSNCTNLLCEWNQFCWRMRGLRYHMEKLNRLGKITPAALNLLWDRQCEIEMKIDEMHRRNGQKCAKVDCECTIMENYKYFFMMCADDMKKGKGDYMIPLDAVKEGREVVVKKQSLLTVMMYFKEQMVKRIHDVSQGKSNGPRNVPTIYHQMIARAVGGKDKMIQTGMEESIKEKERAAIEAEKKWKREAVAQAAALHPGRKLIAKTKDGRTVPLMDHAENLTRRQIESLLAGPSCPPSSSSNPSTVASSSTGTSSTGLPMKAEKILYKKGCTHDLKTCNCTFDDMPVDLTIGERKPIHLNKRFDRKPTPANMTEFRRRIFIIVNFRKEEKNPIVRVVTCMVNGIRWRVAYCGDYHNFFTESVFHHIVTQYMFAIRHYVDASVIIYNFVEDRFSQGKERIEALLKDFGVKHHVVCNLECIRDCDATDGSIAKRIVAAYRGILMKVAKEKQTVWYSGSQVKDKGGRFDHLWRKGFEKDRELFNQIVTHHAKQKEGLKEQGESLNGSKAGDAKNAADDQPQCSSSSNQKSVQPPNEIRLDPERFKKMVEDSRLSEDTKRRLTLSRFEKNGEENKKQLHAPHSSPEPRPQVAMPKFIPGKFKPSTEQVVEEVNRLFAERARVTGSNSCRKTPIELWEESDVADFFKTRETSLISDPELEQSFVNNLFPMFGEMELKEKDAIKMKQTRKLPRNSEGIPFVPKEVAKTVLDRVMRFKKLRKLDLSKLDSSKLLSDLVTVILEEKNSSIADASPELSIYAVSEAALMEKSFICAVFKDKIEKVKASGKGQVEPPHAKAEQSSSEDSSEGDETVTDESDSDNGDPNAIWGYRSGGPPDEDDRNEAASNGHGSHPEVSNNKEEVK